MAISASSVMELRQMTGAGMMDCKRALTEADGDMDKAVEILRKAGAAKADKKAGRIAAEGVIKQLMADDQKSAFMLEVNSETDFVARDENFNTFVEAVAQAGLKAQCQAIESLNDVTLASGETVEQARKALIGKIGENISLRRCAYVQTEGALGSYMHGNRIGVLVNMSAGTPELAKDLAMHVAASRPIVVSEDDVPSDLVEKERDIFTAQAEQSGKPADIVEKMVVGRIKKFLAEVSLVGQPFVKEPGVTVGELLKKQDASVSEFLRYEVGEGIEKATVNFAEEVKAQAQGN